MRPVVGRNRAKTRRPEFVFNGALHNFLDIAGIDGVIVPRVVGNAVVQHHKPGAASHLNIPRIRPFGVTDEGRRVKRR